MKETKVFETKGMECGSCEKKIEKALGKLHGVFEVKSDYESEKTSVTFDPKKVSEGKIIEVIESSGYSCESNSDSESHGEKTILPPMPKFFYLAFGISIIVLIVAFFSFIEQNYGFKLPELNQNVTLAAIFFAGILTSFHCIAMCGSFVVGYSAKNKGTEAGKFSNHAQYGFGKLVSYTVIGGFFGLVGSIITFTPFLRGMAALIAGIFLVIFGLNTLNVFPILRKIRIKQPDFISRFNAKNSKRGPLFVGLANGLMIACGPLQAMYVLAAATGSVFTGATYLLVFGLGTLPLMLGFGALVSVIGNALTSKFLKYSGVVVIFLGILMLGNAFALLGVGLPDVGQNTGTIATSSTIATGNNAGTNNSGSVQEIKMVVDNAGFTPNKFLLEKGVKTKWIIDARQLNGCNSEIIVPSLNIDIKLKPGIQTVEFTPQQEGTINWSCGMGMLRGAFLVKINVGATANAAATSNELNSLNVPKGMSCGGSGGGGCGCGAAKTG